jgi:DnaJ-domain-containing protein 1
VSLSPQLLEKLFVYLQGSFLVLVLLGIAWALRPRGMESGFKLREADRVPPRDRGQPPGAGAGASSKKKDELAHARLKTFERPALPGIRIDGAPHEILGIRPDARPEEIKAAWRKLMKSYHPDKVGRPGSREWQDAQKIAEALNRAKDTLLAGKR